MVEISAPRYCPVPFPQYRFVPGRNPHPTADPRGHSYQPPGAAHEEVTLVQPGDWAESQQYLYGCDLYNHAYWWEAHESWEALWQLTDKQTAQGRFLRGLIQTAACHLKLLVGHLDGVSRLRHRSLNYLREVHQEIGVHAYMGLHLGEFRAGFEAYYAVDAEDKIARTAHDPAKYPYLALAPASAQPQD